MRNIKKTNYSRYNELIFRVFLSIIGKNMMDQRI